MLCYVMLYIYYACYVIIYNIYNKQLHILIMLYTQQFLHLLLISRDDQAQLTVLTDTSQAISMGFPYGISIWDFHGISGRHIGPLWVVVEWLSSGKHTKNYGKSPFLMGKSTISMTIFNSYFDITRGYRWIFSHVDGLVEIYHWNIEV